MYNTTNLINQKASKMKLTAMLIALTLSMNVSAFGNITDNSITVNPIIVAAAASSSNNAVAIDNDVAVSNVNKNVNNNKLSSTNVAKQGQAQVNEGNSVIIHGDLQAANSAMAMVGSNCSSSSGAQILQGGVSEAGPITACLLSEMSKQQFVRYQLMSAAYASGCEPCKGYAEEALLLSVEMGRRANVNGLESGLGKVNEVVGKIFSIAWKAMLLAAI